MGHKRFAPSSAKRDMSCTGAIAMIEALPASERDSGDTIHSRRGTCAHAVGEMCLEAIKVDPNTTTTPDDYLGMEVEGIIVDEKIVDGATVYVDYCRPIVIECHANGFAAIEESYSLEAYVEKQHAKGFFKVVDGSEMGGTGDLTAGVMWGKLYVIDYKNGYGVVEVEDNPQLLDYAAGALDKYEEEYEFEEVVLVVVQPNAAHHDGFVREWSITPQYVHDHMVNNRLPQIEHSLWACKLMQKGEDISEYLAPSDDACQWCPAKARCKAAMGSALDKGGMMLAEDPFGDHELSLPDAQFLTPQQERLILDHGDEIINFVTAVRQRQHKLAEQGEHVEGWKLVKKNTHRKIKSGVEGELKTELKKLGLHANDYHEPLKLMTPPNIEKALRSKGVEQKTLTQLGLDYFIKPEGGNNFVLESAAGKAVKPALEADFEELFDDFEEDLLS